MKRWGLLCVGVLLFAGVASAQEAPKLEIFGGYSYVYASISVPSVNGFHGTNYNRGVNASAAYNLNNWFGLVGDFGYYHASQLGGVLIGGTSFSSNAYSYLGGPKFSYRTDKATVFAQALFGGAHASIPLLGVGQNSFAMNLGAGADVNVTPHFAIRVVQAEYALTRFSFFGFASPASQNNLRLSIGVVVKL